MTNSLKNNRRKFLKTAGGGLAGAAILGAPAVHAQTKSTIKWRMQTYAGASLAAHVVKPAIDSFNKVAGSDMQIELFFGDQLVPTGELFRAMQKGTIDAVAHQRAVIDDRHALAMKSDLTGSSDPAGAATDHQYVAMVSGHCRAFYLPHSAP